jgi:hypothetical protein
MVGSCAKGAAISARGLILLASVAWLSACAATPTTATPSPSPSPTLVPVPSPTPSAVLPISGAYRLTIGVEPSCDSQLPTAFQTSVYDVDIRPAVDHSTFVFLPPDVAPLSPGSPEGTGWSAGGFLRLDFSFLDAQPPKYSLAVLAGASDLPAPSAGTEALAGALFVDMKYTDATRSGECLSSASSFTLVPR